MRKLILGTVFAISTIAAAPVVVRADNLDRRIELINQSHETIREFHASNVDERGFQEDILGRRVLPPGREVTINLNDGTGHCHFDFMTVMEDGQKVIKRDVDVCRLSNYTIYD